MYKVAIKAHRYGFFMCAIFAVIKIHFLCICKDIQN
jgi:hypothetical protein